MVIKRDPKHVSSLFYYASFLAQHRQKLCPSFSEFRKICFQNLWEHFPPNVYVHCFVRIYIEMSVTLFPLRNLPGATSSETLVFISRISENIFPVFLSQNLWKHRVEIFLQIYLVEISWKHLTSLFCYTTGSLDGVHFVFRISVHTWMCIYLYVWMRAWVFVCVSV